MIVGNWGFFSLVSRQRSAQHLLMNAEKRHVARGNAEVSFPSSSFSCLGLINLAGQVWLRDVTYVAET